jgi:hypothetical protein
MTKQVAVSRDGSWKIEVEAFRINLFVYNAIGVTTRVYARSGNSWRAQKVDGVVAEGSMGTSRLPGVLARLPNSPNVRRNDSEADTRAWSVGIGVTWVFDAPTGGFPPNPGPGGGPAMLVDRVTGSGSATWRGETLRVGPISQF